MYAVLRRRRPVDNPSGYARSVLVRLFLDARRRRASSEVVTDRLPERPAGSVDTEGVLSLRAALAGLSGPDRTVLVLRYLCDLTPAEVAHDLGITEGAVRTRASRAAARVRAVLGDDFLIETGEHDGA
jgi:RNA polymerase sigma factor (sigma-70 family)